MPREKESYRDNLERLMDRFPGKEILSLTEVSQYTGMGYASFEESYPYRQTVLSQPHGGHDEQEHR